MILVLAQSLAACGFSGQHNQPLIESTDAMQINDNAWVLEQLKSGPELQLINHDMNITLTFEKNRVQGKSACNNYFGAYQIDGNKLSFSKVAGTRMACLPKIMAIEQTYLSGLAKITSYRLSNNRLQMLGEKGEVLMVFTKNIAEKIK